MQAARDENSVPTLLGTLDSDGRTTIAIKGNPTTHGLLISDGSTGSDNGPVDAPRDENSVPGLLAVSEDDGETVVVIYADINGNLLVDSN